MMTNESSNILLPATDSLEDIPVPQNPLNIKEPIKSSNEILSELFSAFNAKPPNLIEDIAVEYSKTNSDHEINSDISLKHTKKHKKHKKHKKVKKRTRSLSEASEVSCNGKKSKKSKKKRSKLKDNISSSESTSSKSRKHKRRKVESSDSEGSNSNDNRKENIKTPDDSSLVVIKKEPNDKQDIYVHQSEDIAKRISETIGNVLNSVPLVVSPKKEVEKDPIKNIECQVDPLLLTAPKSAPDLESEDSKDVQQHLDKLKPTRGKIQIKNLKFSSVFEETVRQVEEKAKLKAERYEEGEISDSSSEPQRSPSPISSDLGSVQNSSNEIVPKEKKEKKKHRHHHKSRERYRSRSRERHRSLSRSHSNKSKYKDRQDDKSNEQFSRSKERNRSKERIRHRSRESQSRSQERHREKSKDKSRERSRERKSYERTKEKSYRHHHRHSSSSHRHHSYSKDHSDRASEDRIDKRKLLEIARKNALSMLKTPQAASDMAKVTITAGGKTVDELTDFCKLLSKKDADGHESISSDTSHSSDSESEKPFHHPFQIKDRPSNIVMNIRNSVALPVKTMQEKTAEQSRQLRLQFPVSSGQQHRKTESEWVPVSPKKDEPLVPTVTPKIVAKLKPVIPAVETSSVPSVFPELPNDQMLDIGSIVSHRLTAIRKLQENPNDCEALSQMYKAQKDMQCWAESKQQPGQFTGSTGVKVLSQAELSAGFQAWVRKDQLQVAAPVNSGMGMTLLQKMGWRPGEGLGKNKEGTLQPLLLDIKLDKKGLVSQEELPRRQPSQVGQPRAVVNKTLEGKHPVSLLNEFCSRRRMGPPHFELCFEDGPDHKKNFVVKVKVNGIEYKPAVGSPNKKQARAEAALICLKSLGVLPP